LYTNLNSIVHGLKPGDFSIVGGMGDSLATGPGAEAKNFLDTLVEYRGRSFRYFINSY